MDLRGKLMEAGIANLKEFGYPAVTKENLLTDMIYGQFFKKMLEETVENYPAGQIATAAKGLLEEIEGAE